MAALRNSDDGRCQRCRRKLSDHAKVWVDRGQRHYICPQTKGHAVSHVVFGGKAPQEGGES